MSGRPRFVLDTNVLVDALCFARSIGRRAFELARRQGDIVVSTETIGELVEVVRRPRLARIVTNDEFDRVMIFFSTDALLVAPTNRIQACRDPKDDKFLELALAAAAGAIQTRDDDLLVLNPFRGFEIIEPETFVTRQETP